MKGRAMIAGAIAAAVILVVAALLAFTAGTSTPPFHDGAGNSFPGAIAEQRMMTLGGVPQYVLLRGRDRTAPLLIVLHGGPGTTEMPLFRVYNAELEDHFLVVHWDQRGTNKSWSPAIDPASMTRPQLLADLDELVDALRAEFGQDKVILLAHSWGTVPGIEYAAAHPGKVAAYIGVGQIVAKVESDRRAYEWVLAEARAAGDADAVVDLEKIGPPPYDTATTIRQRAYTDRYGGSLRPPLTVHSLTWKAFGASEISWRDYFSYRRGFDFSLRHLYDALNDVNLRETHTHFGVPVAFILGRHDHRVDAGLSAEYFQMIDAPAKELIWFENSAHSPPFEEPERFNSEIVRLAETLTGGTD